MLAAAHHQEQERQARNIFTNFLFKVDLIMRFKEKLEHQEKMVRKVQEMYREKSKILGLREE